ncbi:hypothetical protein ACFLQK_01195 [bacterium]
MRVAPVFLVVAATVFTFGCSRGGGDTGEGGKPAEVSPLGKENIAVDMKCPEGLYGYKNATNKECCVLDPEKAPLSSLQEQDMEELESLCVIGHIGDEGVKVIAASEHLSKLKKIYLKDNDIGPTGVEALANSKSLSNLRQLHMEMNFCGDEGARIIASSKTFKKLKGLNLTQNGIGNKGATSLSKSTVLKELRWLILKKNDLSDTGIRALVKSKHLKNLKILNVSENRINPKQREKILNSAPENLKLVL